MANTGKAARAASQQEMAVEGRKVGQVLAAAQRIFMDEGYGSASMDAIAREANVSKATLYAYYPSKHALFAACVSQECDKQRIAMEAIEAEHLPVNQTLLRIGLLFMRFVLRPEVLAVHRVVVGESGRFPELGRAFYESGPCVVQGRIGEYLQHATERGELNVPEPLVAAELFLAMVKGAAHLRGTLAVTRKLDTAELEHIVMEAVRVFIAGYTPATPSN